MNRLSHGLALFLFVGLCSTSYGQPKNAFHFAWISDTHIGSTTGAEDLSATVRDINEQDSLAFVILSGDITELGSDEEIAQARTILQGLNKPYYIIPGNHDTKWSESGATTFLRVFGADRFVFSHEGMFFFGLHQGPLLRMGDGHFAQEDLRWLDSLLATVTPTQPLIFITHYPLDDGIDNWYELTDRLRRFNTQAVLVGHGHGNRRMEFEGIPAAMGRSNLRARREIGGYTIAHLRRDSLVLFERRPDRRTLASWHSIGLGPRTYATPSAPFVRPDPSAFNRAHPNVKRVWSFKTGWTITGAPAVSGDRVIVGDRNGTVRAFATGDGTILWTRTLSGSVHTTPAVSGDRVVVTTGDGSVTALDRATGRVAWSLPTGKPNVACPSIVGGNVYVGSSSGRFYCLSLKDGSTIWSYDSVGAFVETKPLVTERSVVFGAWDSYLYALDRTTGALRWKWNNGTNARGLSPAAAWPVESDGRIYVAAPDRASTVLDEATGAVVWRTKEHVVREAVGRSEDGSRFYAKGMNDSLFAFNARSATKELAWATHAGFGYDIDPSMPHEAGGRVFFGTKNGLVFALNGKTGAIVWSHKISNTIVNTVAPVDAHRVVVTDFDGTVMLLSDGR
jgi:outer membrane protein assembly factor BamB/predicted phosphodiesterase